MWSVRTCLFKLIFRGSPLSSLHSQTTRAFFGFPKWARFVLKGLHTRCSLAWLPLELSVIVSFCSSVSELKCHFFQKWLPWPIHLKKNSTLSLWPSFSTLQYVLFSLYDFIVWNDFIFFTSLESICLTIIYILWQQGPCFLCPALYSRYIYNRCSIFVEWMGDELILVGRGLERIPVLGGRGG